MTPEEQADLLIRVDQNVINLIKAFDSHIVEDNKRFEPLEQRYSEQNGMVRLAGLLYGMVGAGVTLVASKILGIG